MSGSRGTAPRSDTGSYRLKGLYLFIPVAVAAFALGIWGFMAVSPASSCHAGSVGAAAFKALMLVAHSGASCSPANLEEPPQLLAAQFLLPFLLVLGTIFTAVKIILINLRHDAQVALIRTLHGHTIICGLSETGLEAVRQLVNQQGKVVAISSEAPAENARICESLGAPLIFGDATLRKTLAAAGFGRARALVLCTGSDAMNMEICLAIDAMKRRPGPELLMFPEVQGSWIHETLAEQGTPVIGDGLQLHPFRANEVIARKLLRNPAFQSAAPAPCLLLLGFGDLAQVILRRVVLLNYALPGTRLSATCYDTSFKDAANLRPGEDNPLWWQFAGLDFVQHNFGANENQDMAVLRKRFESERPDSVIITLPEDVALRTANALRSLLDTLSWFDTPIFVRVRDQGLLGNLLGRIVALPLCPHRLTAFGDLGEVVAPEALFDEHLDVMARALHDSYLANSSGASPARLPWQKLPERYRRSNRAAADHLPVKLGQAGYVLTKSPGPGAPPDHAPLDYQATELMAAAEHYRWSLALRAAGWRWDAERSDLLKTHPLLLPWEQLPEQVRKENRQQVARLPDVAGRAGFNLRRVELVYPGDKILPQSGKIACCVIDATKPQDWSEIEQSIGNIDVMAVVARAGNLRAEALQVFASKFPRLAKAVNSWGQEFSPRQIAE